MILPVARFSFSDKLVSRTWSRESQVLDRVVAFKLVNVQMKQNFIHLLGAQRFAEELGQIADFIPQVLMIVTIQK